MNRIPKLVFFIVVLTFNVAIEAGDMTTLNTNFLPNINQLATSVAETFDEFSKTKITFIDEPSLLLFYVVVDDRRPLLIEHAVIIYKVAPSGYILVDYFRRPYSKLQSHSNWEFLYFPDEDFSGNISAVGWRKYDSIPTHDEFITFLKDSSHQISDDSKIKKPRYKFLATYQNHSAFRLLFSTSMPDFFVEP